MLASTGTLAATTGFVSDATGNFDDWNAAVSGSGGTTTNLTFASHPIGALQSGFFSGSGVTLMATNMGGVQSGGGPNNGNTSGSTSGDGAAGSANYLFDPSGPSSLRITFDQAVSGAGLFISDYFNPPGGNNPLTIEAFDGAGTSLGIFTSIERNFQPNNLYLMGLTTSTALIRSLLFTDVNGNTGDSTGITGISFATAGDGLATPIPAALPLFASALGLGGLFGYRRQRKVATTPA